MKAKGQFASIEKIDFRQPKGHAKGAYENRAENHAPGGLTAHGGRRL
jgi:hypothetical protein